MEDLLLRLPSSEEEDLDPRRPFLRVEKEESSSFVEGARERRIFWRTLTLRDGTATGIAGAGSIIQDGGSELSKSVTAALALASFMRESQLVLRRFCKSKQVLQSRAEDSPMSDSFF